MPKTPQSGGYAKNKGMETSLTKKMGGRDQLGNNFGNGQGRPKKWGKGVEMEGSKNGGGTLGIFLWGEGTIMSHKI